MHKQDLFRLWSMAALACSFVSTSLFVRAESGGHGTFAAVDDYEGKLAIWDAEGQHLSMEEILTLREKYGLGIYFFRDEAKHALDLRMLKRAGLILIKVAHPLYRPFKEDTFISDGDKVRAWAAQVARDPRLDGAALDVEGTTATSHAYVMAILAAEMHRAGKTLHAVPHFTLFERFPRGMSPGDFNQHADIVWPWLYNRLRRPSYREGLLALLEYWKGKGVTVPIYPIFDHGRTSYSGITPAEASEVPAHLAANGVTTVCLFQPHVSYRETASQADFRKLWNDLGAHYGSGSSRPKQRPASRPVSPQIRVGESERSRG